MKFALKITIIVLSLHWLCPAQIAIKAETLHPVSAPAMKNALVLINNGKIAAVGLSSELKIPEGYKVEGMKSLQINEAYFDVNENKTAKFESDYVLEDNKYESYEHVRSIDLTKEVDIEGKSVVKITLEA